MILKFTFDNYRCFKEKQEIDFRKCGTVNSPMNILAMVGRPGMGKTSFLGVLKHTIDIMTKFYDKGFSHNNKEIPSNITLEFLLEGIHYKYEIQIFDSIVIKESLMKKGFNEPSKKYKVLFKRNRNDFRVYNEFKEQISESLRKTKLSKRRICFLPVFLGFKTEIGEKLNKFLKGFLFQNDRFYFSWECDFHLITIFMKNLVDETIKRIYNSGPTIIIEREIPSFVKENKVFFDKRWANNNERELIKNFSLIIKVLKEPGKTIVFDDFGNEFDIIVFDEILNLFICNGMWGNDQIIFTNSGNVLNILDREYSKLKPENIYFVNKNDIHDENKFCSLSDFFKKGDPGDKGSYFRKWNLGVYGGSIYTSNFFEDVYNGLNRAE